MCLEFFGEEDQAKITDHFRSIAALVQSKAANAEKARVAQESQDSDADESKTAEAPSPPSKKARVSPPKK